MKRILATSVAVAMAALSLQGCSGSGSSWEEFAQAVKDRAAINCTMRQDTDEDVVVTFRATEGWTAIYQTSELTQEAGSGQEEVEAGTATRTTAYHSLAMADHNVYEWMTRDGENQERGEMWADRYYSLEDLNGLDNFLFTGEDDVEEVGGWLDDPDVLASETDGTTLECAPVDESVFAHPTDVDFSS